MENMQGQLLVASPHLSDPNFFRSVVFVADHNDDGALGLILNRMSDTPLQEVWKSVVESTCSSEQNLFVGGPVEGPLMAIHTQPQMDGVEVFPRIYFSSEKRTLEKLVCSNDGKFRIFSGYAGWGAGQLDGELEAGGWLTAPAKADLFFSCPDSLWERVTHSISAQITGHAFRSRHAPLDPLSN